jgi:hypothetical protein
LDSDAVLTGTPEEWIFLPRSKFGLPFTAKDIVTGSDAKALIEATDFSLHIFTAWRKIERTGPDPVEFEKILKIPGMDLFKDMPDEVEDSSGDKHKVTKVDYFTVMTLPSLDTPLPPTARPNEIYLYRPRYHQDNDGIMRRIKIFHNPQARQQALEQVNQSLGATPAGLAPTPAPAFPVNAEIPTSVPMEKKVPSQGTKH